MWQNPMWLKDPEDRSQHQLQDHQKHPWDHWNQLQGLQNLPNKQPCFGGAAYMYGSEAPKVDPGGPGGASRGLGASSDVGPQAPSATWGLATAGLIRPNFKRFVLAPTGLYRHQTKTPETTQKDLILTWTWGVSMRL